MATSLQPVHAQSRPKLSTLATKVSRYDRVAGMIISLLMLIGGIVAVMFFVWLTATLVFAPSPVPVKLVENIAGRGDHAPGFARDLEAPGEEEMPELAEPQVQTALEAVTEAVSSVAASMDVYDTTSVTTSKGKGGLGDSRPAGPLGEGENIIPRWERWELRYQTNSLNAYAQQLDFFKVELGVFGGGKPVVEYANNLAKSRPDTRQGPSKQEKRIFFTWKSGTLKSFDEQLMSRAGLTTSGRIMMQYIPEETEDRLAWIEMENAKKIRGDKVSVKEFLRTVFGVRAAGRGFEFYIIDQRFRPLPP